MRMKDAKEELTDTTAARVDCSHTRERVLWASVLR